MNEYSRLKWADDPRWSNTRKRDVLKSLAEIGEPAAEARVECQRLADDALAGRLADAKLKVATLYQVGRSHVGALLTDVPAADGRAAYELMDSAQAVERSLQAKLARYRQRTVDCRARVADKTVRLAALHTRIAHNRFNKSAAEEASAAAVEAAACGPGAVPATVKVMDALRLCNRRLAGTHSIMADNEAMYKKLNEQLVAEIRQQAATVVELISYGSTAQKEHAQFDRRYHEAMAEHERLMRRKHALSRHLKTNIVVLESNRDKLISSKVKKDLVEKIDFEITEPVTPGSDNNESSGYFNHLSSSMDSDNKMPLTVWIDNGPMENYMYRKKESFLSKNNMIDRNDALDTDTESLESFKYTYPVDKVNLLKFGNKEYTKAMEAVEYVCDTLDFSDIAEVLQYFTTVKNVEKRIKKMVNVRKHLYGVLKKNLESAAYLNSDRLNCVPESTLVLDENKERIQRDGLEVQKKQLYNVNIEISKYGELFNELWFQLDNLARKLDRCQVPPARRYQVCMKNRTKCSETMADAVSMLEGLCLKKTSCNADGNDYDTSNRTFSSAPETAFTADRRGHNKNTSGWELAVDACRKLAVEVHTKVKSCMAYVGGRSFDPADRRQLTARAYFTFKQQCHIQNEVLKKKEQNRPALQKVEVEVKDPWAGAAAAGILTREQMKHQAEEIVQYFLTPKDADNTTKSRKPISFRKARIII